MPEQQLNRWIKRIALLFFVVLVVFVALYAADRFRMPAPAIADQRSATLEEAVRKDPADFAVRGQLADVYLAEARYPEAIAQYTAIIDAKKDLEAAYASRGRAYELSNQLDAAKADYTQVVGIARDGEMAKVDPTLELAYYGLGSIALQENKPQAAVDQLLLALAIQRTDADAMNLLGAAYLALDKPKDAVDPLRKAVEFVPVGWADPYVTLAKAYTKAGQADEATWASALAALATGDIATAEASLTNITNGDAKIDAYVGLGLVAETRSDSATAADWYRKALALDSTNQLASFGLGRTAAPATAAPSVAPSGAPSPSTSTEGLN
ncbi:MAG: tetratricopeptide repeat protein [Candidatus Limnocylindrales bacterium]